MKRRSKIGLVTLLPAMFFASCENYPGYDDYVTEQLVTVSSYDTKANFKGYKTYNLYDSVVVVTDSKTEKISVDDPDYPELQELYNAVKSSVPSMYTYQNGRNADLAIIITLMKTTNLVVSNYGWWWYDYCYWYYWGCGYYPYYPYSYPVVVGGYSSGTVAMDMFDTKTPQEGTIKQPVVWTGIVRGVMTGDHTDAEINGAIKECFTETIPFQN